jgi:hypothetical protein
MNSGGASSDGIRVSEGIPVSGDGSAMSVIIAMSISMLACVEESAHPIPKTSVSKSADITSTDPFDIFRI